MLLSFPIIALLSVASSLANGFWVLLPLRYFVGFGFGLGQPSAIAILMEVSPGRYRPLNQALAQIAFALGELYCCLVMWFDDPRMIHLHWRTLLVANAVPAVLFWLASWAQLQESPVFSAINGKPEEAHEALDKMRRLNGKPDHSIDFAEASAGVSAVPEQGRLSQLPPGRTAALCIVCFCYNITIYGAFTAFPQLIPRLLNQETQSAALQLAQGAALEIPADLVGLLLALFLPRKWVLYIYFIGLAVSCLLFSSPREEFMLAGYYGCKFFPQTGSIALFVLIAESFAAPVRATGTAVVLGVGRLGASLAPVVYEALTNSFHTYLAFFYTSAFLMLACFACTSWVPETAPRGSSTRSEAALLREDLKASHGTMEKEA